MKLGLQVNRFSWPGAPASTGATWRAVARDADQCGLASIWTMDHFFQIHSIGKSLDEPMLEGWTTLGYRRRTPNGRARHPGHRRHVPPSRPLVKGHHPRRPLGREGLARRRGRLDRARRRGIGLAVPADAERFELLEEPLRIAPHICGAVTGSPLYGKPLLAGERR